MKKILLILAALVVFTMPLQQTYIKTEAAVASKAAGATAKKIAKEVIQDSAINQAIKIAANEAKRLNDESLKTKPGYMTFCMDYTYKPGDKCSKPSSIKASLSETDKANIKKQAGTELDKLIAPGGKGFSKWAKFLDWFIPIWLITFAVTAITYAIDPEVKNLFDEAAYNALVALGIISPVESTTEKVPLSEIPTPEMTEEEKEKKTKINENMAQNYNKFSYGVIPGGSFNFPMIGTVTTTQVITAQDITAYDLSFYRVGTQYIEKFITLGMSDNYLSFDFSRSMWLPSLSSSQSGTLTVAVNGEVTYSKTLTTKNNHTIPVAEINNVDIKKMQSIKTRLPYAMDGNWYTDVLMFTASGQYIHMQLMTPVMGANINNNLTGMSGGVTVSNSTEPIVTNTIERNVNFNKVILAPPFEETDLTPSDESSYKDDKGNIALLPPAAFPYIEESTGEQVERIPAPTGDGYVWQKPDGTIVPEDNVIPKPEDEPQITPAPDGTPQYTPAPTPSNPNPEPVPLQPNPNAPPTDPPPTEPEEPPLEPFPEGSKCDEKLKFPVLSPLKETFSTSFPFSIPWDIERAINAAFGGIGNEKPSFKIALPFMGDTWEINITTPELFDKWKPFTDTFLLFTFDVLIMFGVYRFVKGAGS